MKEELLGVIKKLGIPNLAYELRGIFKMISDTEKSNEDWDRFALYFDQVHNNFLHILKTKYPQLSPTDLKLCAYLTAEPQLEGDRAHPEYFPEGGGGEPLPDTEKAEFVDGDEFV
jgi:hypothetical protein